MAKLKNGDLVRGKVTSVIDGDSFKIKTQEQRRPPGQSYSPINSTEIRCRLAGMDAPEKEDPYYKKAEDALRRKIGNSQVTCRLRNYDSKRGRWVVICGKGNLPDVGAWMVVSGHAKDHPKYDPDYSTLEDAAKKARRGMHK